MEGPNAHKQTAIPTVSIRFYQRKKHLQIFSLKLSSMVFEINIMGLRIGLSNINQSQASVPIIEKPSRWKSDILSKKSEILIKDAGHGPASLLNMSILHRCFSLILLVKTNYLVPL